MSRAYVKGTDKKIWQPILAMTFIILLNVILLGPEALRERMATYDSSSFIATGAFYLSVFDDFNNFIVSPLDWVMEYYRHYPGFSIRRYGPLFGLVEGFMYAIFGISAITAKWTILLFSTLFGIAWFLTFRRFFKSEFVAFFSVLLMLSLPVTTIWGRSVRLDIPSMMFFAWGCYFYSCYLDFPEKGYRYAILTALMLACCYYTYPLPSFAIAVLFLYMLIGDREKVLRKPYFHITTFILFVVLICPLLLYFIKTGQYMTSVVKVKKELSPYIPVKENASLAYWTFYLKMMWKKSTMLAAGLLIWALSKTRSPIQKHELFFLLWFILGYLGLSWIPSKNFRYHLHFIIAAAPLTVIGVRDTMKLFFQNRLFGRHLVFCSVILLSFMFFWNLSQVSGNIEHKYVQGVDKAAYWLTNNRSENMMYFGRFSDVFSFYSRKYDTDRSARILRLRPYKLPDKLSAAAKQYSPELSEKLKSLRGSLHQEKILQMIRENKISMIVMESENLNKGKRKGIYDIFYAKMKSIINQEKLCKHIKDFPVLFGLPGNERQLFLKVYRCVTP